MGSKVCKQESAKTPEKQALKRMTAMGGGFI
jgi:hypothetical protein